MKRFATVVLMAGLAFVGGLAHAAAQSQDGPAAGADDNGRYSFHHIGDGFVRLDSRTGQVAQCGWSATGWSCNAMPDERAALDSEIARLQLENAALKKSLLSHGLEPPSGVKAEPSAPKAPKAPEAGAAPKLPSDAELDRAVAFMKKVWRRLVEMMADFQRDIQRKS